MSGQLSIESFNSNFIVRVADYKPNIDTPSTITVVYEVKCVPNKRVGVFIDNVDTTTLVEGFTYDDVVQAAWDSLKNSVAEWSTVMLAQPQNTTYTVTSTTDDISLQDFTDNFEVQVIRYELYPKVSPSSWCVGFHIYCKARPFVNLFVDGNVGLNEYCNNVLCNAIVGGVWDSVKSRVCSWAANELQQPQVIDTTFVPTSFTF